MWLWKCGWPIAVRLMGTGGRKGSNAASRKNARLIAEMVTTREPKSRNLTSRARRLRDVVAGLQNLRVSPKSRRHLLLKFHRPTANC
jgi:hypothetical protein